MVPIPDGTAATIVEAVRDVVFKKGIYPVNRLYGLGTDGSLVGPDNYSTISECYIESGRTAPER